MVETKSDVEALATMLAGGPLYRWQSRLLAEWFSTGAVPSTIDVPTGLGKTKVIALWLAARAAGANLPRRLVYVVDRRAVVDQATTEAEIVAENLERFLTDQSIAVATRDAIRSSLGLEVGETLPISTLRGAHLDNRRWLDRVSRAAIVVGTVDMIGSRLLFGGYGVSARMRPVHAGLLGCDALYAVDESHLVPPFEALLRGVVRFRETHESSDPAPRALVMALSATSFGADTPSMFRLHDTDRTDEAVARRLGAEKRLVFAPEVPAKELADTLAAKALALGEEGRRIIVFCNSRKDALKVRDIIESRTRKLSPQPYLELLVGERRMREREIAARGPAGSTFGSTQYARFAPGAMLPDGTAAYLVATSAGEVGIDLDADDLVVDLVAWERMVQRFGRVNRRAQPGTARIVVVPAVQDDAEAEDTIAASRLAALRAPFASDRWLPDDDGAFDVSPRGLEIAKAAIPDLIEAATTTRPLHPTITAAVVDAWAMTQLREHPGRPSVGPWLRGWIEQRPQTSIVWRRFLPLGDQLTDESLPELSRFFAAAPPHVSEILEAPTDRVVRWLKACFEEHATPPESDEDGPRHPLVAVVLDSRFDAEQILTKEAVSKRSVAQLSRLLASTTLVVDARIGGLDGSGLLDERSATPPPTIDAASWDLDLSQTFQRRIRYEPYLANTADWRPQGYRWSVDPDADEPRILWVELWRGEGWTGGDAAILRFEQALELHHSLTEREMRAIAGTLGLTADRTQTLAVAAGLHDAGKARRLWQEAMHAPEAGRPFAKLKGGASPSMLNGYRHEFGSMPALLASDAFVSLSSEHERRMALHLVATHHGRARPTIAPVDPDRAPSASVGLAREVALRYALLQQEVGAWDLAWWEAVLQSADWKASGIEKDLE